MKNWIRTSSLLAAISLASGCVAITPVASVAGAAFSGATMYYTIKNQGDYMLVSKDCLFYVKPEFTDEEKAALGRPVKETLVSNNLNYEKLCRPE